MKKFAANITANFVGNVWTAIMNIAFIPVYINLLGVEAYGLIGIYATLQAICVPLDIGLGTTLNREMARLSVLPGNAVKLHNLLRTLEILYWIVAVFIGITIYLLAPLVANYWLRSQQLSFPTIQQAIVLIGITIAAQWPFTLYAGGLLGLQQQVMLNIIVVVTVTLRFAGVIPILWYVSPTIQMYFLWQGFIGLIQTFLVAVCLWRSLPISNQRARFQTNLLLHIWRFAAGMSGITLFGIILLQMDKIILSKLLTLEMFGYYTMASMVAMGLYRFIAPIFNATYPEFTQLVSIGNIDALTCLYHRACQIMTVLILPIALIIAFFSSEILLLWTRNPLAVKYAHMVLSLLIIGTALNGLMTIPYALQLAYGWTKLTLYSNIIAVIILLPSIIIATIHYGPVGAACSWLSLNVGYLLIQLPIMHTRLLPTAKLKWYIHDIIFPLIASLSIIFFGKLLFEIMSIYANSSFFIISYLMIVYIISLIFSILFAPEIKKLLINRKMILF